MKRQRHIQTHILLTLIGLTAAILLAVGLSFNLAVRGYIRSRVTTQLARVSESASSDRRGGAREHERRFDGHPDRVTGTAGSAAI